MTTKSIRLGIFDIEIIHHADGICTIRSGLHSVCPHCNESNCFFDCEESQMLDSQETEPEARIRLEKNRAYDGLEALILAHAKEDVDIQDPNYLDGIEVAVEAIENNI